MTNMFWVWIVGLTLLPAIGIYMALRGRKLVPVVALALTYFLVAASVFALLGVPSPWMYTEPEKIIWFGIIPPKVGIVVLGMYEGERVPRYFMLPYSEELAREGHEARGKEKDGEGDMQVKKSNEGEYVFYNDPPMENPPK